MTPFGPQLLGQTEKTLTALLRVTLTPTGLTEPQWVTLRLATMLDGQVASDAELATVVADRAQFTESEALVAELRARGLIVGGRPTEEGRATVADVLERSEAANGSVWRDLPADDVAATERVLNAVLQRARDLVGAVSEGR